MIFCHCAGVTDTTISQVIEDGATCVDEIARRCGAGQYCTPCREELAVLLARAGDSPCRAGASGRSGSSHQSCSAPAGA